LLFMLLFAITIPILPAGGYSRIADGFWPHIEKMILPIATLGITLTPSAVRFIRTSMLEVLSEDYIILARVKGNTSFRVNYIHALRNSLIPIATSIGLQVTSLMGGAVIIEQVFQYPGMGYILLAAIQNRDYPTIQGCLLLFSIVIVTVNLAMDIIYLLIDPRMRKR